MLSVAARLQLGVAAATTVVGALALGAAVGAGHGAVVLGLGVVAVAVAVGLCDWRRSLYGLLVFLPVSGVPIVLAYPHTTAPELAKDLLFVIPAYLGFAASRVATREAVLFSAVPVVPFVLLTVLVVGQLLNPSLPSLFVGAIGAKVWLLYIPLYILGYHLVESRADLFRLLRAMSIAAILPVAIGLAEALLIYAGHAGFVWRFYGSAASSVTQDFTQFGYPGGGSLHRIPSTFSFVSQFYGFLGATVFVTYAWWRVDAASGGRSWRGALLWLATLAAVFLSGAREAFVVVPLLLLVLLLLDRADAALPARVLAPGAVLFAVIAVVGATASGFLGQTFRTARQEFDGIVVQGFTKSVEQTWLGFGTGVDTVASRYAHSTSPFLQSLHQSWSEGWYAKTILELGVPGLVLVALIFCSLLRPALRIHRRLDDPELRTVSAALIAFLLWAIVSAGKGPFLDLDPVNVYFWLLAGVLAKVAVLGGRQPAEGVS